VENNTGFPDRGIDWGKVKAIKYVISTLKFSIESRGETRVCGSFAEWATFCWSGERGVVNMVDEDESENCPVGLAEINSIHILILSHLYLSIRCLSSISTSFHLNLFRCKAIEEFSWAIWFCKNQHKIHLRPLQTNFSNSLAVGPMQLCSIMTCLCFFAFA
jgi:hypothetical protein